MDSTVTNVSLCLVANLPGQRCDFSTKLQTSKIIISSGLGCLGWYSWQISQMGHETGFKYLGWNNKVVHGWGNSGNFHFDAASSVLKIWNMPATIPSKGGRVQLQQPKRRLVLKLGKMANWEILGASIVEIHQVIRNPLTEVQEGKNQTVKFPGHKKLNAVIDRHLALVYKNRTKGCHWSQNATAKNPQICWRIKVTRMGPHESGADLPDRHLCPEWLMRHLVTVRELTVIKVMFAIQVSGCTLSTSSHSIVQSHRICPG